MYGYNAGQPMAIPIYTVLPYCVIQYCVTRSKRVKEDLFYCLGGRPVSMQNFRLIVHIVYLFLHGCGLHYNVLSGLSVKQEIKGLTT